MRKNRECEQRKDEEQQRTPLIVQLLSGLGCANIMKMENSVAAPLPRFNKCCFIFGLRSGVLIFVSLEALFWAFISFVAIYSEVKYINTIDLLEFTDDLDRDWYYFLIYEHPRDTFTERVRSKCANSKLNLITNFTTNLQPTLSSSTCCSR
jgi:hypothetical protein